MSYIHVFDRWSIALDGVSLWVSSDFRYLGSLLQNDGDIDRDVNKPPFDPCSRVKIEQ